MPIVQISDAGVRIQKIEIATGQTADLHFGIASWLINAWAVPIPPATLPTITMVVPHNEPEEPEVPPPLIRDSPSAKHTDITITEPPGVDINLAIRGRVPVTCEGTEGDKAVVFVQYMQI